MSAGKKVVISIFTVALILRVLLLVGLYSNREFFDPNYVTDHWDNIAGNIIRGNGFSWIEDGSIPTVSRSPMYAVFLAALLEVAGGNLLIMRVIYLILDSLIAVLVFKLGISIFANRKAATIAAFFYCIYLLPAWHASKFAPDSFFSLLLLLAMMLFFKMIHAVKSGAGVWRYVFFSALLFGTAMLTKKTILFLPIVLALFLLFGFRFKGKAILVSSIWLMTIVLTLSPWVIRNYKVSGKVVITQTLTWFNFWYGEFMDANIGNIGMEKSNLMAAKYIGDLSGDGVYLPYKLTPRQDVAREEKFRKMAITHIRKDPAHFLAKTARNILRFWYLTETGRVLIYMKAVAVFVFSLFAFGVYSLIKRKRFSLEAAVILMLVLYFNIIYAPVFSIVRYMIPVLPYVCLFVGIGIWRILEKKTSQHAVCQIA